MEEIEVFWIHVSKTITVSSYPIELTFESLCSLERKSLQLVDDLLCVGDVSSRPKAKRRSKLPQSSHVEIVASDCTHTEYILDRNQQLRVERCNKLL